MRPTVLVVDDDDSVRKSLIRALSIRGFRVLGAGDAEEALQLALAREPDIVVMDLQLRRAPGNDAARRLLEHPRITGVRLIALSATPEDAAFGLYDAVLTKPCAIETLVAAIERVAATGTPGER